MQRVCGAEGERNAFSARRCWCGGLFCWRGGFQASKLFRRTFGKSTPAYSLEEFEALMMQGDLFDGHNARTVWRLKLAAHRNAPPGRKRSA